MDKINVCFVLGGFTKVGGIGRVTSIIANKLARNSEINVVVVSFSNLRTPNLYELDSRIKQEYLFEKHMSMSKAMLSNASGRLRKILKKNDINIVVACGAMFYPLTIVASLFSKIRTVCWEHSNVQNTIGNKFQMQARWIASKLSDKIVTLTKHDQSSYVTKYKIDNVHQIYNPIDDEIKNHVRDYKSDTNKIISVGRLAYQKNFQNLIEVANLVVKEHPNIVWDIYGEGEDHLYLEKLIQEKNLSQNIFLKGKVKNLYDLYNNYSLLVMTSRFEGFPMTLLEGAAFGLPLISYDILTGPNEIIVDGVNGFLVEPENVDSMANKITSSLEDVNMMESFSKKNVELKENYSLDEIVSQWTTLFKNLENGE